MEWISVKNRLPKEGTWVLAFTRNQIEILFMDSNKPVFWLQDGDWEYDVTHWMELPPPPNKVDTDLCACGKDRYFYHGSDHTICANCNTRIAQD